MGRKSKLTDKQWQEAQARALEGESIRSLAKAFGIAESTMREKISGETAQIKSVANQIVATNMAVKALPISAQITAHSLASRLQAITENMLGAADQSAATAHRLSAIANNQVQQINDVDPFGEVGPDAMRGIAALTNLANEAAKIPLNLINANKEQMSKMQEPERKPMTLADFYGRNTRNAQSLPS